MKTNLLLVDDNALYRETLRNYFQLHPALQVVGECSDGSEVLPFVNNTKVDVVLMDISMEGMNGIHATQLLTEHDPSIKVIIHSSFDSEVIRGVAKIAGASGYVSKGEPIRTLVEEISNLCSKPTALNS